MQHIGFLLQNLLFAQHVWGTFMPIISSSRVIQMAAACGYVSGLRDPANRTHNPHLHTRPTTCKPKSQVPQAAAICINLELLIMGIMVPETCWTNNKFCNKNQSVASSLPFISTYMHSTLYHLWHISSPTFFGTCGLIYIYICLYVIMTPRKRQLSAEACES